MNSTRVRSCPPTIDGLSISSAISIGLVIWMLSGRIVACDFCRPLPGNPFESEHLAAIEVAMATQVAAESGQIDLNPSLSKTVGIDRQRDVRLAEISPRELVRLWIQTRPAKQHRALRNTVKLIFIDVDYTCLLDIRLGEILEGDPAIGPANIRLVTTQAGFCNLLETGIESSTERQLVAIESHDELQHEQLSRLFSKRNMNMIESSVVTNQ